MLLITHFTSCNDIGRDQHVWFELKSTVALGAADFACLPIACRCRVMPAFQRVCVVDINRVLESNLYNCMPINYHIEPTGD